LFVYGAALHKIRYVVVQLHKAAFALCVARKKEEEEGNGLLLFIVEL
jgi:hypothetical protein